MTIRELNVSASARSTFSLDGAPTDVSVQDGESLIVRSAEALQLLTWTLKFGEGVACGLIANWLWSQMRDKKVEKITINKHEIRVINKPDEQIIEEIKTIIEQET